jgi:hypothetical protein
MNLLDSHRFELIANQKPKSLIYSRKTGGGLGSVLGNSGPSVNEKFKIVLNAQDQIVEFTVSRDQQSTRCILSSK